MPVTQVHGSDIAVCGRRDVSCPNVQLVGLAPICLKHETKADAERDLRDLISAAGADVAEKARREGLLWHLESADKRTRWNWQSTA
jgi:hypothetical protein